MDTITHRGIFLLHEGLQPTILESQVLTHIAAMRNENVEMEVWSFALTRMTYQNSKVVRARLEREYRVNIRLFRGVRPAVPFSRFINSLLLMTKFFGNGRRVEFVHARTEYSAAVAASLKRMLGFRLIWDARGDTVEEFRDKLVSMTALKRVFGPLKQKSIEHHLTLAARKCDFAIFVSDELQKLQGSELELGKTLIAPCRADVTRFYFDPKLRSIAREKLGISQKSVLLIYSGSAASYQCVPETMALINEVLLENVDCFALIVSPTPEEFGNKMLPELADKVFLRSGTLTEMNLYLNAADIGIMLRKRSSINWVASPVKFAEYSLVGLKVATGKAVSQVLEYGSEIGNLVDEARLQPEVFAWEYDEMERRARAEAARKLLGRTTSNYSFSKIYQGLDDAKKGDN